MNIRKSLLGLRNLIATINAWLWIELIRFVNNDDKRKADYYVVEETTVGGLLLQVGILFLFPIAIAVKIIAICIAIWYKIMTIRLAKDNAI